nr:hypothetical protein BaRGS_030386 [Batillaria attramentaria]
MERLVNARLVWVLESEGLLSDLQCGFRQGRSTVDHLVRFESFIRDGLQQILADFPGFRRIFTDGSKSEDGRVGAAAVMDGRT